MVSAVDIHIQTPAPPSRNGNVWVWENGLGQTKFSFKTRINGMGSLGYSPIKGRGVSGLSLWTLGHHSTIYFMVLPLILPLEIREEMLQQYQQYLCHKVRYLVNPQQYYIPVKTH